MRYVMIIIGVVLALTSCQKTTADNQANASFEWLIGDWIRTNGDIGATTYESWIQESRGLYIGRGYTIVGLDTVSGESIQLLREDQQWRLEVTSFGDDTPTVFPMAETGQQSFTCIHPTLDFPNRIWYHRDGELLKATVAGDDLELEFVFQPVTGE